VSGFDAAAFHLFFHVSATFSGDLAAGFN